MKKLDVNLKVLIAIIVLFGLSISLMAQPRQKQHQSPPNEKAGYGMLNLSDEQQAEMKEIRLAQQKEVQPLKDELLINKAKINALIKKDNPDMKEIVSLVEANGKILTEIQITNIESKVKVRTILNDEQKVMFDSHYNRMQKRKAMAHHKPQGNPRSFQAKMHSRSR